MPRQSQYGSTFILADLLATSSAQKLTRVQFAKGDGGAAYDESWLQELVQLQPGLLPVSQIEPLFENLVPICRELPMKAGFVDNLLITPDGNIVLVECKLWRNPDARRVVIAQIIDYASELATWSYETLDHAVKLARSVDRTSGAVGKNLFELVSSVVPEADEASFHDAVSLNLRLGRILLLIVGDGIQEGVETMTSFLQKHAGLDFRLSLVEVAVFELPSGGFFVQPRILAKTENIVRAVVRLEGTGLTVTTETPNLPNIPIRKGNITEEAFYRELDLSSPGSSNTLQSLLSDLLDLNIRPDLGSKTLTLRWITEDGTWNLGTVVSSGELWMDYHAWQASNRKVVDQSKQYLERMAQLVPGATLKPTKATSAWNLTDTKGRPLPVRDFLADDLRRKGWVDAIYRFQMDIAKQQQE